MSLDVGLRMDGISVLTPWDLVIEVFHSVPNNTGGPKTKLRGIRQQSSSQTCTISSQQSTPASFQQTLITLRPIQRIVIPVLRCSKWWSKVEVPQWDMFREPTELLWICFWTGSIWIQKFNSVTLTSNTNSQTCWLKGISHVMSATIFFIC